MFTNEFQKTIWEQNYKLSIDNAIEDTWLRIATAASAVETQPDMWRDKFYDILEDWNFVPGGRIMANIGAPDKKETTLMNCFAHSPQDLDNFSDPDSINGIYTLLKAQAKTLASEGGYGMNFSWLRPEGTYVKGTGIRTPGVLKFMELWDKSSEIITSGTTKVLKDGNEGKEKKKIRKGAQMGILEVWHPDIIDFIEAKQTPNRLTKFNLSVGINAEFIKAVIDDAGRGEILWTLSFPDTSCPQYKTEWKGDYQKWINKGYPRVNYQTIKVKDLWDKIMTATYTRNEPGVLFLDLANKLNPVNYCENIATSNPCVVGDTLVFTNVGWIKIKNLEKQKNKIKNLTIITIDKDKKLYNSELKRVWMTQKDDEIYKVCFENNEYILTNYKHKLYGKSFNELCVGNIYDQYKAGKTTTLPSVNGADGKLKAIVRIEKTEKKEDVYDLTAVPNYNFFSLINRDEYIVTEPVLVNNIERFYIYDVVDVDNGQQKFAIDLDENDEIY